MILHLLDGDVPPLNGVTLRAIGPHFPLVNIIHTMAILAILPHIGEDRLDVALHALHLFMHAAKRIARLIVIEFWHCADRTPAGGSVTVLARYRQGGSMRTASAFLLRGGKRSTRCSTG